MKRWHIVLVVSLIIVGLFLVDGGAVYIKQLINRSPKAAFSYRTPTRTLKYIAPTDRDLIMFLNDSRTLSTITSVRASWRISQDVL